MYGFPTPQNSEDIASNRPLIEQYDHSKSVPLYAHEGDDAYYGPFISRRPPGFYAPLIYDATLKLFRLLTRPGEDYSADTEFAVFTTTGIARLVSATSKVFSSSRYISRNIANGILHSDGPYSNTLYSINITSTYRRYSGDLSCETQKSGSNGVIDCINKGDKVFVLDTSFTPTSYALNPKYLNIHKVVKIGKKIFSRWRRSNILE